MPRVYVNMSSTVYKMRVNLLYIVQEKDSGNGTMICRYFDGDSAEETASYFLLEDLKNLVALCLGAGNDLVRTFPAEEKSRLTSRYIKELII